MFSCGLLGLEDISNSELYRGKKETRTSPLLSASLKMRLITYMFSTCLCLWLFFSSIAYIPTLPHRDPVPEAVVQHVQRHFKWELEYMFGTPDCVVGINGLFPGPTIRAKAGDTISVEVTNKLHTEGVVIHWHGITKLGTPTPWADGIASINPGETFLYRFKVNKAGIYVYHGHFGMQRSARLYGSLIIDVGDGEKGPFHYDGVHDQEADLSSKPFRWTRGPRKLLIKDDKEIRRNMASVHGSISNPSGSESFSPDDQLP